jgi:hypothetical protein
MSKPLQDTQTTGIVNAPTGYYSGTANGCQFNGTTHDVVTDFTRVPRYDIYGNNTYPASDAYKTGTNAPVMWDSSGAATTNFTNMMYLKFDHTDTNLRWVNYQRGVYNATDNAAYRARMGYNSNIPASLYMIGLGGNAASTDYLLMQRMANDPSADIFNSPALYPAATLPTSFNTQNKGKLVYSSDFSDLRRAFLNLSSQILRLSQ